MQRAGVRVVGAGLRGLCGMSGPSAAEVKLDEGRSLFYLPLPDGAEAVLEYELGPRSIDFTHTGTPPQHQGKGIAKIITQVGFAYAEEKQLKIIPTCTYTQKYAKEYATDSQKKLVQFGSSL